MRHVTTAVCAFAVLLAASTGFAGKPVKENFSFVDPAFLIGNCDGFDILSSATITGFTIFKFDEDGFPIGGQAHLRTLNDIWYNSANPDIYIEAGPGQVQNVNVDFVGDPPFSAISGVNFRVNLPGYGVVFLNAGLAIIDLSTGQTVVKRGPGDFESGNVDMVCELLTP